VGTPSGRRVSGIAAALVVYALTLALALVYSRDILEKAPALPQPWGSPYLLMIAVLPLALIGIAAMRTRELLAERAKGRFGWKLRSKLALLFVGTSALASIPQGVFLFAAARFAVTSPTSDAVGNALEGGVAIAIDSYERIVGDLERTGRTLAGSIAAKHGPSRPDAALKELALADPDVSSIEFFEFPDSPRGVPRPLSIAPADAERYVGEAYTIGLLPKDGPRLRYFAMAQGSPNVAVLLTASLPEGFDAAAEALTSALADREALSRFSDGFVPWLLFFYTLLVAPLLLVSVLFSFAAADSFIRPLRAIEKATRSAESGDLGARMLVKDDDELGEVARGVNALIANIASGKARDAHDERVSAWQDIAQRLAHELKNPLTPIRLAAERVLRKAESDPEGAARILKDSMIAIVKEVEGMTSLLGEFKSFARLPQPSYGWIDAREVIEEAIAIHEASGARVEFDLSSAERGISLRADREHVRRAISNVILNAIDAMDGKGRVSVTTELVKRSDNSYCRISIRDEGRGIPAELRDRVFTPYFTTKEHGTGLGLAIAERIAVEHGGSIRFQSEEGAGTTFFLDLPVEDGSRDETT
jgi:nitrogen fixation/metabolism regulation signal transduction histidine kinase